MSAMDVKQSIIPYLKWALNIKHEYQTILKAESEKAPESHLVPTPPTLSVSPAVSVCRLFVPALPSPPPVVWWDLVALGFSKHQPDPWSAVCVCLERRAPKSVGRHWREARNTQKRPPKATALMGTGEEDNTNTASPEMCSYLSISSIYRSSTIITQFKFSREKAVFRMSFTISPKYTFCSGRFMHDAVLHDSLQCTIFLHTLSWHKKNLGICDSNGNQSLLQGKNILNSFLLALPPLSLSPSFMLYLCLPLSLSLILSFFFPSSKFLITLTFSVPFDVF